MSYTTQDRFGGFCTTYKSVGGTAGTGRTWWPDYGAGTNEFSYCKRGHPTETIFKDVQRFTAGSKTSPAELARATKAVDMQFRNPQPAMHAILHKEQPSDERRIAAKASTQRQSSLNRLEMRQRNVDRYLGDAPIRAQQSKDDEYVRRLDTTLSSLNCSEISRSVYEKNGWLVGRSKPSIADGRTTGRSKSTPLSFNAMMFRNELTGGGSAKRLSGSSKSPKQLRPPPESFNWDPRMCLPVPRGGWNSQPPSKWPEAQTMGEREFSAPVDFGTGRPMLCDGASSAGSSGAAVAMQ
eukprot:TRINITY_DN67470_c0_g1_i1.p1 TRINITY_DN67470_c0_g1~~TRINITY_DN67470_c0_g1_i1.p1  ORF type:complete len:295 (-),score=51.44 TRINITY_DN67470_c0_g1_i1:48-932(-)